MSNLIDEIHSEQLKARNQSTDESKRERAKSFLDDFIILKFEEGYTDLVFSYNSNVGLQYKCNHSLMIKSSEVSVPISIIEEAVKLASKKYPNILAHKEYNEKEGVFYKFSYKTKKKESENESNKIQKPIDSFKKFLKAKFLKISNLLPNEHRMFCTIFLNENIGSYYVSNIDTYGTFDQNYFVSEIEEAVEFAKKEGIKVKEEVIDNNKKMITFSINLL